MIRKLLNGDIDRVADIWLKTNLKAHYFIEWENNFNFQKWTRLSELNRNTILT